MKKFQLILIILFTANIGNAQMRSSQLILKNGDTLSVVGAIRGDSFKYRTHKEAKPQKVHSSEINNVKILFTKNDIRTYKFIKVKGVNKPIALQELVVGKNAELYAMISHRFSSGAGGVRISHTVISYYAKKMSDSEFTFFGPYGNGLKRKVMIFFKDCDKLITKIENKEFRIRSDVEKIVEFYNKECQ